ncbi:MAG: DNA-protecting protein DprA [Pseudobacteriovorax sp.]|nr:DNA-protecting protein DprA [Pseudobacteriovorax sp.]
MKNIVNEDTKATILLTCRFENEDLIPLSGEEYGLVVKWLMEKAMSPANLFSETVSSKCSQECGFDLFRIGELLGRGFLLGFHLESFRSNGIWTLNRGDAKYPKTWKKRLGFNSPPLIFGVGDPNLLATTTCLAVIGSRDITEEEKKFCQYIGELCSQKNVTLVSGCARGTDSEAMTACLNSGGIVVGIVSEELLKKLSFRKFNKWVSAKKLVLASPFMPDSSFSRQNAFYCNQLIYGLAQNALVVSSKYKKGGTWQGAALELGSEKPIPVFVRSSKTMPKGNSELMKLGALEWKSEGSVDDTSKLFGQ